MARSLMLLLLMLIATPECWAQRGDLLARFNDIFIREFALDEQTNRIYASLPLDDTIAIFDGTTLEQICLPVFIGASPYGLTLSEDGSTLYAALNGEQKIGVFDTATHEVTTISIPYTPYDIAAGKDGRLYIVTYDSIIQVDSHTGQVAHIFDSDIQINQGGFLQIDKERNTLYFANTRTSNLTLAKFDISHEVPVLLHKNENLVFSSSGQDLTLSHDGEYIYYPCSSGNGDGYTIFKYATSDLSSTGELDTGAYPRKIALSPDDKLAYVTHKERHVDIFSTDTFDNAGSIGFYFGVYSEALQLIVDRSGEHLFASFSDKLVVFDTGMNSDGMGVFAPFPVDILFTGLESRVYWRDLDLPGTVTLSISRNGSEGPFETIAENINNDGSYYWNVTGPGSDNCVIRVESDEFPASGLSRTFSVNQTETFDTEPIHFTDSPHFYLNDGRLHFANVPDPEKPGYEGITWTGNSYMAEDYPKPGDINYLENVFVSSDISWEGGNDSGNYGLFLCSTETEEGYSSVNFNICKLGYYNIYKKVNGVGESIIGWTRSSLLSTDGTNNQLAVKKVGPYFHFYINEVEVERIHMEGLHGGGVGIKADYDLEASFDDFKAARISPIHLEVDPNSVTEDFEEGVGGFSETKYYNLDNGKLSFKGDGGDYSYFTVWSGGFHSGGLKLQPNHSNFFSNYTVSVDTEWAGGEAIYGYGLIVDASQNEAEENSYVRLLIDSQGWYAISKLVENNWESIVGWTQSSYLRVGATTNTLKIEKSESQYHFYANNGLLTTLTIEGFPGGAAGLYSSLKVDVNYDNFKIISPGTPPVAVAEEVQASQSGDTVQLDGSASSGSNSTLQYDWIQLAGPPVLLSNPTTAVASFMSPETDTPETTLTFQLLVNNEDKLHASTTSVVQIRCKDVAGDVDGNCVTDLADAVASLQVASGLESDKIRTDFTTTSSDIGGNQRIGVEEAIEALNSSAGI